MAKLVVNPTTGALDLVNEATIDGIPEVETYLVLPPANTVSGQLYRVRTSTGVIFINRQKRGVYKSDGIVWTYFPQFTAADIPFDPSTSNLTTTNTQAALVELQNNIDTASPNVDGRTVYIVEEQGYSLLRSEIYYALGTTPNINILRLTANGTQKDITSTRIADGGGFNAPNAILAASRLKAAAKTPTNTFFPSEVIVSYLETVNNVYRVEFKVPQADPIIGKLSVGFINYASAAYTNTNAVFQGNFAGPTKKLLKETYAGVSSWFIIESDGSRTSISEPDLNSYVSVVISELPLPIASPSKDGIVLAGSQTLGGEKVFQSTFEDRNTFAVGLTNIVDVNNSFNNTSGFHIGMQNQIQINDNQDHDDPVVAALFNVSHKGTGTTNNFLAGVSLTVAVEDSGRAEMAFGSNMAVNTAMGGTGTIGLALGANVAVEHEGDGLIDSAVGAYGNIVILGNGDITEGVCYGATIEDDGTGGQVIDGYILKADLLDAVNKYGIFIDVKDSRNLLHSLTLKAAFDVVPSLLIDVASVVVDASKSNIFDITLQGNRTLEAPTGAKDGQSIVFRIRQDATGSRTLTLDSAFRLGASIPAITLSLAANSIDYLTVIYNAVDNTFDVVDFKSGY